MEYNGNEMFQGTGHPAEIQEFYSRFSAGCLSLFLVAKSVRLVMPTLKHPVTSPKARKFVFPSILSASGENIYAADLIFF